MIRLSLLSEGRSRFGRVSKFINKTTMANYAVVEWDVKSMDEKEIVRQLEFYSTLRHRRIGSVYGYHIGNGMLSIFRTFLPTGAVADQLKIGPLMECIAQRYFRQLLEALEFLHERHVTHGDIKNAPKNDNHKRRTLLHCAPEMFKTMDSWEMFTPATDIWAAGCVLVAMVTRYAPFQDLFLSLSTQELHEKLFEANQPGSRSALNYESRTLIPTSSKELADIVDATFERDPQKRLRAGELLERFFPTSRTRGTSRLSQSTRESVKRDPSERSSMRLYNDEPTPMDTVDAHKSLLQRLYESAERREDEGEEGPLKFCMKWYGSRVVIFVLLLLKWIGMVLLAAVSLGFVAGSVFLAIYVIYSGIGVVCQCQLNEGFVVLIALILLPIIILLTTLCVNNSCEKYKQAKEDGSLEKCRYVYPQPEDDIILCGIIVVDGKKEERKVSVKRKLAGDESDPTAAVNLPKGAFVRGVAGIA
uniref:Serine threonine protein kinase-related domain containing protein n=1 Tax=Haemonchus contortus TaxID=6289 RepID=W6NAK9_HAECO